MTKARCEVVSCGPAVHYAGGGYLATVSDGRTLGRFLDDTFDGALAMARAECERRNTEAEEPKAPEGYEFSARPGTKDAEGCALAWSKDGCFWRLESLDDGPLEQNRCRWLIPAKPKPAEPTEADVERLALELAAAYGRSYTWYDVARAAYREIAK